MVLSSRSTSFFVDESPVVPNLNSGKDWSETDIEDLITALDHGLTVETTAEFLCRDAAEVREKMKELGLKEIGPST